MGKYLDKEGVKKLWDGTKTLVEDELYTYDTNGYEFVDMGEAGIWATCNIGASKPEEYGLYFQWGDTKGYVGGCHEEESDNSEDEHYFEWSKYKYGTSMNNLTKYNSADVLKTLEPEDDAAHINMGGNWRMPTKEEFRKLYDLCKWEWVADYEGTGISGTLFKLKTDNSKQLFFPATGYCSQWVCQARGERGSMWASSLHQLFEYQGLNMNINSSIVSPEDNRARCIGLSIRGFIPAGTVPKRSKYFPKTDISQETGDNENLVMSQKAVNEKFENVN